jgi:hypothetical protein
VRKKPKAVRVGNITVTPISPKERRNLDRTIKKRHDELRKRYREIHGKVVDWINHSVDDNCLYVNIRFKDKTQFSLRFIPQIATHYIDLCDVSTGDFKPIREYYNRRDLS